MEKKTIGNNFIKAPLSTLQSGCKFHDVRFSTLTQEILLECISFDYCKYYFLYEKRNKNCNDDITNSKANGYYYGICFSRYAANLNINSWSQW